MTGRMAQWQATFRHLSPLCSKLVSLYHGQLRCTRVFTDSLALTVAVQPAARSCKPFACRFQSGLKRWNIGRSLVALDLQAVHGLRWDQSALVRGNPARHSRRCCQVRPSYQAVLLTVHRQRAVHLQDFQATTSRYTVLHYCQSYTCQRLDCSGAAFQPTLDKTGNAVGGTVTSRHWHEQKLASRIKGWQNCLQKYMSEGQDYVGHPPDPCFSGTLPHFGVTPFLSSSCLFFYVNNAKVDSGHVVAAKLCSWQVCVSTAALFTKPSIKLFASCCTTDFATDDWQTLVLAQH